MSYEQLENELETYRGDLNDRQEEDTHSLQVMIDYLEDAKLFVLHVIKTRKKNEKGKKLYQRAWRLREDTSRDLESSDIVNKKTADARYYLEVSVAITGNTRHKQLGYRTLAEICYDMNETSDVVFEYCCRGVIENFDDLVDMGNAQSIAATMRTHKTTYKSLYEIFFATCINLVQFDNLYRDVAKIIVKRNRRSRKR